MSKFTIGFGKYTIGQAIENIKPDQVAIKVKGNMNKEHEGYGVSYASGFYVDSEDYYILKTFNGNPILFSANPKNAEKEYYTLMDRELYETVLATVKSVPESQ